MVAGKLPAIIEQTHRAMATEFSLLLVGEDVEHLAAVATSIWEDIDRTERLLSRFDPASEVYRVNREAVHGRVRISVELAAVLRECADWWDRTGGAFDVVTSAEGKRLGWECIAFDESARTVKVLDPTAAFDFGGYGKGYALDRAAQIVAEYGVTAACLGGGGSSWLVRGNSPDGLPWRVAIEGASVAPLEIPSPCAVSTSATFRGDTVHVDTRVHWNPPEAQGRLQCTVLAKTATLAEIASTALLVLGPSATSEHEALWRKSGDDLIYQALWHWGQPLREQHWKLHTTSTS
jgi:thiamine biosynthesis lipoprotein